MDRIPVFIHATDPVIRAGLRGQLFGQPRVEVVHHEDVESARVAVVGCDFIDGETLKAIRATQRVGCQGVVLVVGAANEEELRAAVAAGATGLLRRVEATPERLVTAIENSRFARVRAGSPPLHTSACDGPSACDGLSGREVAVLRLAADGYDTAEIARELAYSERTIKNVFQGITNRFQLKNRTHAVAYAVREGFI